MLAVGGDGWKAPLLVHRMKNKMSTMAVLDLRRLCFWTLRYVYNVSAPNLPVEFSCTSAPHYQIRWITQAILLSLLIDYPGGNVYYTSMTCRNIGFDKRADVRTYYMERLKPLLCHKYTHLLYSSCLRLVKKRCIEISWKRPTGCFQLHHN
jgi:hypothetical protein